MSNNNKKSIISSQLQQMIEANNTMQRFKEDIVDIYNYALSKEKEGWGYTSSQQVQELLRRENHLQIHNERWMITIDDEDDKRGK